MAHCNRTISGPSLVRDLSTPRSTARDRAPRSQYSSSIHVSSNSSYSMTNGLRHNLPRVDAGITAGRSRPIRAQPQITLGTREIYRLQSYKATSTQDLDSPHLLEILIPRCKRAMTRRLIGVEELRRQYASKGWALRTYNQHTARHI